MEARAEVVRLTQQLQREGQENAAAQEALRKERKAERERRKKLQAKLEQQEHERLQQAGRLRELEEFAQRAATFQVSPREDDIFLSSGMCEWMCEWTGLCVWECLGECGCFVLPVFDFVVLESQAKLSLRMSVLIHAPHACVQSNGLRMNGWDRPCCSLPEIVADS